MSSHVKSIAQDKAKGLAWGFAVVGVVLLCLTLWQLHGQSNRILSVQNFDHQQVEQQLRGQKNAPAELRALINEVVTRTAKSTTQELAKNGYGPLNHSALCALVANAIPSPKRTEALSKAGCP